MRVLNRSLAGGHLSFYMHALEEFHNCYTPHVLKIHVPFDRIAIQTIHIGKKGSGSKLHADHSRQPEEFELKSLTFVADEVSSDLENGEAQHVRCRMKEASDLGACYQGCEDPS